MINTETFVLAIRPVKPISGNGSQTFSSQFRIPAILHYHNNSFVNQLSFTPFFMVSFHLPIIFSYKNRFFQTLIRKTSTNEGKAMAMKNK